MERVQRIFEKTKSGMIIFIHILYEFMKCRFDRVSDFYTRHKPKLFQYIHTGHFRDVLNWWHVKPKSINKIAISSKPSQESLTSTNGNTNQEFSSKFFAILHQISKNDQMSAKILKLNHIQLTDYEYHVDPCNCCDECKLVNDEQSGRIDRFKRAIMILRQRNPFKMSKNVECIIRLCVTSCHKEDNGRKRSINTQCIEDEFHITIRSRTLSTEELENVVSTWEDEYQASIAPDKFLRYYLFRPHSKSDQGSSVDLNYNDFRKDTKDNHYFEYLIKPTVTFNKLYFRGKEEIVKRLEFFVSKKEWYIHRRIPHNIGFFLHGHPSSGCERTSTIKAIANFTQRHIISISLNDVRTENDFSHIFNSEYVNGKRIGFSKRLYVLEDIDHFKSENEFSTNYESYLKLESSKKDDGNSSAGKSNKDIGNTAFKKWQSLKKSVYFKQHSTEQTSLRTMNFSRFIAMIDQMMERENIMVVINTRSPEWLENILTQPGVINVRLS